jgi:argininosuccinate synthase
MRNLDLTDSRAKLELYASLGNLGGAVADLIGRVEADRALEITSTGEATEPGEESLDRAAMEFGTD